MLFFAQQQHFKCSEFYFQKKTHELNGTCLL